MGTQWWVPNGRPYGCQVVTFFEGRLKTIGVRYSLLNGYFKLTNPKSGVFYPKFHSVVYIPIVQHQKDFECDPPKESNFLVSKVVVIRVQVADFNVVNIKTHPLRVFAQNRKSCITLAPGGLKIWFLGQNDPIYRQKYGCHSKIMLTHASSGISDPYLNLH